MYKNKMGVNMKKFLILFFILCSFSAFAQEQNQYVKKVSPWSIGISGFGYFPTATNYIINDNIGYGGGVGLKFKGNINRFLGFATEFNYTYANKDLYNVLSLDSHIIDIRESLVIQYETYKGENGFVPWLSIGIGATIYQPEYDVLGVSSALGDFNGVGFNVNIGAGLKYNFRNFYTGIFVDWTYSLAYTNTEIHLLNRSTNAGNLDGVRAGIELGFRY